MKKKVLEEEEGSWKLVEVFGSSYRAPPSPPQTVVTWKGE